MSSRAAFVGVVSAAAVLASAAGGGAPAGGPVTLVETDAPIYAFAQDGPRVAWIRRVPGGPSFAPQAAVFVRVVPGGPIVRLTPRPEVGDTHELALGGRRALWSSGYETMSSWTIVGTAAVDDRTVRRPAGGELELDACDGRFVSAVAGDGPRLAYSILAYEEGEDFSCVRRPGLTVRLDGAKARRLRSVPGTSLLAVAGSKLAVAEGTRRVTIRDADSGSLEASVDFGGGTAAIALGRGYIAAIVRRGNSPRLEVRDTSTGDLRGVVPLRGRWGRSLSASGSIVVYSIGRAIHVLDATSFRTVRVAVAAGEPVGLSVEGRRIAWAENARGRGWIRALTQR